MSVEIDAQIAKLKPMATGDLRALWSRLTRQPVPRISPKLLRLALAWELQARAQGAFDRETVRQLAQLDRGRTRTSTPQGGTRLVREWQGRVHVVTVAGEGGVEWEGRSYRSLSEVARMITGTRWSGPAFFGLKQKRAAA